MDVTRIADGLWRWTAPHPEWKAGGGWDRDVGCVYCETGDAVVLVDPLVPGDPDDRARFLEALDRDIARVGGPVVVLLTCTWHERSSAELAERYGGRIATGADDALPQGVRMLEVPSEQEWLVWLEAPATVVPGDVILGTDAGLDLCPASWLESKSRERLADELRPTLDLPVERVLVSHGPPVLESGREALARLLARYAPA